MSDDALIRLSNLKATGVTAKQLEAAKVGRYTYCRDLLAGQKSFGEKAARKIEEKMGWPRGCLDTDEGCNLHPSSGSNTDARDHLRGDTEEPNSSIPTAVTYSPSNLKTTIVLLGNLLGALDKRSREIIGSMLKDLALHTDDAQDIADKAAALATTQKPITRNKELNKAITTPSKLAETQPAELGGPKKR